MLESDHKSQQGILATYLIPGCVGRGVKMGSESLFVADIAPASVWKSGNLEIWEPGKSPRPVRGPRPTPFWSRSWTWIWNGFTLPDIGSYENWTKPNGSESFSNPSLPRHPPCDISCRAPAVHKHAAIKHTTQSEQIWDSCYVFGWHKSQITPECCKKALKTNCRPSGRQIAMQLLP